MGHDREIGRRLEKLMGTSVVKFTDRKYMMQLQERILESHYESTEKRMNNRMNEEIEREKRLILENKMPIKESSELSDHPVFVVRKRMATNPRFVRLKTDTKKGHSRVHDMESAIRAQEEQEKVMDAGSRAQKKKKASKSAPEKEATLSFSQLSEAASDRASMRVLLDLSEFAAVKEVKAERESEGRTRRLQRTAAEDEEGPEGILKEERMLNTMRGPSPLPDDHIDEGDWEEDGDEGDTRLRDSLSEHLGYPPSLESGEDTEDSCSISPRKESEKVKYESPLIKELRRAETVDQLYELAEQIVGPVPPCINK